MSNYSYVIDSTFTPFTMQEMLVPFQGYKEAYDKAEARLEDISDKAKRYEYLSKNLPENSIARQIYEGYNNDLQNMASDFGENGLSQSNVGALNSLKQRYQGEIGRLDKAQTALEEEQKLRRTVNAQDPSMLYATDNLSIDNFLDNNKPDLYSVSGESLYKRGTEIGASASARQYGNMEEIGKVTKYYQELGRKIGYSPELIAKFRQDINTIPELQQAVNATLKEKGVTGHLTGANYDRAREAVVNGIINGAVYKVDSQLQQNPGVLTAAQEEQQREFNERQALDEKQFKAQLAMSGWKETKDGNFEPTDMAYYKSVGSGKGSSKSGNGSYKGSGKGSGAHEKLGQAVVISYNGNSSHSSYYDPDKIPNEDKDKNPIDYGDPYTLSELQDQIKDTEGKNYRKGKYKISVSQWNSISRRIPPIVKEHPDDYTIYYRRYNKDENAPAQLLIIPHTTQNVNENNTNAISTSFGLMQ